MHIIHVFVCPNQYVVCVPACMCDVCTRMYGFYTYVCLYACVPVQICFERRADRYCGFGERNEGSMAKTNAVSTDLLLGASKKTGRMWICPCSKLNFAPWKCIGSVCVKNSFMHTLPRHYMEESGHLQVPAALPAKKNPGTSLDTVKRKVLFVVENRASITYSLYQLKWECWYWSKRR